MMGGTAEEEKGEGEKSKAHSTLTLSSSCQTGKKLSHVPKLAQKKRERSISSLPLLQESYHSIVAIATQKRREQLKV